MKTEIRIFKDLESLSRDAATLFAEQAAQSITERGRFLVALNGGSTPNRLFQLLATEYKDKVDWNQVHVFWGDERCVPPDDPESSYGQARDLFLSHVPIPDLNIHRVNGDLEPAAASKEYSLTLSRFASPPLEFPRFDLVFLGMGEDGHTASLFPGSPVDVTEPTLPCHCTLPGSSRKSCHIDTTRLQSGTCRRLYGNRRKESRNFGRSTER